MAKATKTPKAAEEVQVDKFLDRVLALKNLCESAIPEAQQVDAKNAKASGKRLRSTMTQIAKHAQGIKRDSLAHGKGE